MWRSLLFFSIFTLAQCAVNRDISLRDNCSIKPAGGCECRVKEGIEETVRQFDSVNDCAKTVEVETAENKKKLSKEINEKYGSFKDNCFPRPSGGCRCNVDEGQGETVRNFDNDADCKKIVEVQTAENKKDLNEEIKEKFGDFKENCFPKPSGGCKCTEKTAEGQEVVNAYNDPEQCKLPKRVKRQRDSGVAVQPQPVGGNRYQDKTRARSQSPSSNVRDPVRERAQANYAAVLDELHNKFKGLKEGCYPRPKGCLCVIGKTPDGRDITERRMKDVDCKCKEGETGPQCPAA